VTFTATASPNVGVGATGTVQFQIDGSNVGNPVSVTSNTATYSTTLTGSSHSIAAVYNGDANFASSFSSPVVLTPALAGDANLDGTPNFTDFQILQVNYNQAGNWAQGDFNGDGVVNFTDFQMLQVNYNQTLTMQNAPSVQTTPVIAPAAQSSAVSTATTAGQSATSVAASSPVSGQPSTASVVPPVPAPVALQSAALPVAAASPAVMPAVVPVPVSAETTGIFSSVPVAAIDPESEPHERELPSPAARSNLMAHKLHVAHRKHHELRRARII